jgi:hypothetical protein
MSHICTVPHKAAGKSTDAGAMREPNCLGMIAQGGATERKLFLPSTASLSPFPVSHFRYSPVTKNKLTSWPVR